MIRLWRLAALLLALAWCVSLALPVATFGPGADETWAGWAVLMLGWLGFMLGQFAWLANFLFIAALILMSLRRPPLVWSLVIGGATSLLALHSLSWTWVYRNEDRRRRRRPCLAMAAVTMCGSRPRLPPGRCSARPPCSGPGRRPKRRLLRASLASGRC